MLIQFNKAKNALEKENKNLGERMDEARRQIDAIESLSLKDQGLTGAAYRSLEERIHLRTSVLKAHYVAYQEIQAANGNNISALGRLKPSGKMVRARSIRMRVGGGLKNTRRGSLT